MSDPDIAGGPSGPQSSRAAADAGTDLEWRSLEPDEEIRWRGSPRIQTTLPWVGLAAVVVGAVLVAVVTTPLPTLALLVVPFVVASAAWVVLAVTRTEYAVTSEAVAARRGVLGVSVTTIDLERVQNTSASQHALGRLVGYGTVEIDSAGGDGAELVFRNVENPQGVRALVDRQLERGKGSEVPGSLAEWELVLEEVRRWRLAVDRK